MLHLLANHASWRYCIIFLLIIVLSGCAADVAEPTPTPEVIAAATETAVPTDTAEPTLEPTETAMPTDTPAPTNTPTPTNTPAPTDTPARPTLTPTLDKAASATAQAAKAETSANSTADHPADAFELISMSEAASAKVGSMSFSQIVEVAVSGMFTQTLTQNCVVEQGEIVSGYCETISSASFEDEEPVEDRNELVTVGNQTWMRSGDDEEWVEMPPDFMAEAGFSEDLGQLHLSEFMTDAAVTGETTIGGDSVYEITFELDVETYVASILGEETAAMFIELSQEMSGSGKMWIGQLDFYPRKADIEMIFLIDGETMTTSTQAAYFGYNEPVRILDPTQE